MNPYLSVSELNQYIAGILEQDSSLRDFWLKGEISGFKLYQQSGHLYFTLKDEDSAISAVMFRSRARRLDFQPENGLEVLVRGWVSVFAPQGRYQFPHAIADCPITLFSQQRPLTGRQKPIPEASSMCP
jgi:exodeoxyribonuclease VII large subunit